MAQNTFRDPKDTYMRGVLVNIRASFKQAYESGNLTNVFQGKKEDLEKPVNLVKGDRFHANYYNSVIQYPEYKIPENKEQAKGFTFASAHEYFHLAAPPTTANIIGHVAYKFRHVTSLATAAFGIAALQPQSLPANVIIGIGGAILGRALTYQLTRPNRENEKKTDIAAAIATGTTFKDFIDNNPIQSVQLSPYRKTRKAIKQMFIANVKTLEEITNIDMKPVKVAILDIMHPAVKDRITATQQAVQSLRLG